MNLKQGILMKQFLNNETPDNMAICNSYIIIEIFYSQSQWSKRGISVVPMRFDVGGYTQFLHQVSDFKVFSLFL